MINPFALLKVDKKASKKEILIKVTAAMRSRQYDAKTIAEAQKILFKPLSRAACEFKAFLDLEDNVLATPSDETSAEQALTQAPPDMPLLDIFDE